MRSSFESNSYSSVKFEQTHREVLFNGESLKLPEFAKKVTLQLKRALKCNYLPTTIQLDPKYLGKVASVDYVWLRI